MSIGVMKDWELKLRDLHDSQQQSTECGMFVWFIAIQKFLWSKLLGYSTQYGYVRGQGYPVIREKLHQG